jgi:hypothetical protein
MKRASCFRPLLSDGEGSGSLDPRFFNYDRSARLEVSENGVGHRPPLHHPIVWLVAQECNALLPDSWRIKKQMRLEPATQAALFL